VIRDHRNTGLVERFYHEHSPLVDPARNGHHQHAGVSLDDEAIIKLCRKAMNARKFEDLFDRGDTSGYAGDNSAADQALVSLMAFYTDDPDQLDRLFQRSALCREKWTGRPDYRRRTIEKAYAGRSETYSKPSGSGVSQQSQRPVPIEVGTLGRKLEVVRLGEVERPGPRRYVVEGLVPAGYTTLWHGDGGGAKSMSALSLGVGVAGGAKSWLGRVVEPGKVLFVDFELEAEEQARRVWQLCRGVGLKEPPADLFYLSAVGHPTRNALRAARRACEEHAVTLLIVDSLGPALEGDAETAKDVIGFYRVEIDPFRALGAAVLIIDHQAKLQAGESYQRKGAFGSVYKANLARSVVQAEATERGEGTLSLRIRQKKHNFGPLADPFGVKLAFSEESVSLKAVNLDPAQMAEEATLTAPKRVKLALQDGPLYPSEIAEATGVLVKTVKNSLTELRKNGTVEPTGEKEGREERVRLIVPTSLSLKGDGTRDDKAGVLSEDPKSGESPTLEESREKRPVSGGLATATPPGTRPASIRELLSRPPNWLHHQMAHCRGQSCPENQLKALAASVAADLCGDATRGAEILPEVEAFMTHGVGCDCEACL
jgi:AAA domain